MLSLEYITNFSMMLSRKKKLQILSVYSYVKISVYFGPTKSEVYFFITVKKNSDVVFLMYIKQYSLRICLCLPEPFSPIESQFALF